MARTNSDHTFDYRLGIYRLSIFCLFFLMAYIAFAIGIDLGSTEIVRLDGQLPMPKFLNFPNSLWDPYQESGFFSVLEPQYQSFYPVAYFLKFKANTLTLNLFILLNFALAGFGLFCYLTEINPTCTHPFWAG